MRKHLLFGIIALLNTMCVMAQDVIFLGANDSIVAKVISVGTSEITYQKWTNLQGPVYSMSISQIAAIRYANGTYDFFKNVAVQEVANTSNLPSVIRDGNTYIYGDSIMNKNKFQEWLKEKDCPAAYQQFKSGHKAATGGWFLMVVGLGLDIGSIIFTATNKTGKTSSPAIVLGVLGGAFEIVCIPALAVGYSKMHRSVDTYNASCKKTASVKPYWAVQASNNGIGLAYHF